MIKRLRITIIFLRIKLIRYIDFLLQFAMFLLVESVARLLIHFPILLLGSNCRTHSLLHHLSLRRRGHLTWFRGGQQLGGSWGPDAYLLMTQLLGRRAMRSAVVNTPPL